MFGFTYPCGTHYTTRGTHCYGNIGNMVPGPGHQGLCSKKTIDVTQSVEQRRLVHLRLVRINTCAHGQTMKLQWKLPSYIEWPLTSLSLVAVVSGLPAGCCLEEATLWLINGQWFGPARANSDHQWAHFPSYSHSHARPVPSYDSACVEWENERQEVVLPTSGPSPVSSPANSE